MNMIKNTSRNQKFGWVLFIIYLMCLAYFLFFAEALGRTAHAGEDYSYNIVLFKEIKRFYTYRHIVGFKAFFLNVYGNIICFIPFGFFLPIVSRRGRKWYNTFLLGFAFSLCIEVTQLVVRVGSFDVDDLLLNTIGGAVGYVVFRVIQRIRIRRNRRV